MQKGFGIAAIILAIIAMFIPLLGTWLTLVVGFLAIFAYGPGIGLGVASILLNIVHILFLSPLLWATTQSLAEISMTRRGEEVAYLPWLLIAAQIVAGFLLYVFHHHQSPKANQP